MPVLSEAEGTNDEYDPATGIGHRASGVRPKAYRLRKIREWVIERTLVLVSLWTIASILLIFAFLFKEAAPVFFEPKVKKEANVNAFFLPQQYKPGGPREFQWQPVSKVPKYSMMCLIQGTLKVTLVTMLLSFPLGVGAAIYTAELAPRRLREVVKPTIEMLAGIPSVVVGAFALLILATWIQDLFDFTSRLNSVVCGAATSLAVIPIIYTVSEDALSAVPRSLRDASLALGADRWQTARKVVLPAAASGIFAATVLGFGRAIGETMIAVMAAGNAPLFSWKLSEPTRTLAATIAQELGEVVYGSPHYCALFFVGLVLFAITFFGNIIGQFTISRLSARRGGE